MPDAQPVTTEADDASWPTAHAAARAQPGPGARLPETPTTAAERRRRARAETDMARGSRGTRRPVLGATLSAEARRWRAQSGGLHRSPRRRQVAGPRGPPGATRRRGARIAARPVRAWRGRSGASLARDETCPSVSQPPARAPVSIAPAADSRGRPAFRIRSLTCAPSLPQPLGVGGSPVRTGFEIGRWRLALGLRLEHVSR